MRMIPLLKMRPPEPAIRGSQARGQERSQAINRVPRSAPSGPRIHVHPLGCFRRDRFIISGMWSSLRHFTGSGRQIKASSFNNI